MWICQALIRTPSPEEVLRALETLEVFPLDTPHGAAWDPAACLVVLWVGLAAAYMQPWNHNKDRKH